MTFLFVYFFFCRTRCCRPLRVTVSEEMQGNTGGQDMAPITLKWNPKNLEIKTRGVERTLEPLVIQVSVVENHLLPVLRAAFLKI